MITLWCGATAAGWFNAAYTIILVLASIPTILLAAVYPRLAATSRRDRRAAAVLASNLTRYTFTIGLALALALDVLAATIVPALYGLHYLHTVPILQVLAWSVPGMFLSVTLVGVLEAVDRQWFSVIGIGSAVLVAIPGSLMAARLWGYLGATAAYVVCHLALAGIMIGLVSRVVGWDSAKRIFVLPATAAGLAGLVLGVAHTWPPLLLLPAVCLTYGMALILSGAVGRSDLPQWRGALRRGYHLERTT
jgi:O-antigen/teichoic acid export membrane protein